MFVSRKVWPCRLENKYAVWCLTYICISMIKTILTFISNIVSPSYWASYIGDKTGLYEKAGQSSFRAYVLNLHGWKWWFYQIVICGVLFIILELLLNIIGLTLLPF